MYVCVHVCDVSVGMWVLHAWCVYLVFMCSICAWCASICVCTHRDLCGVCHAYIFSWRKTALSLVLSLKQN